MPGLISKLTNESENACVEKPFALTILSITGLSFGLKFFFDVPISWILTIPAFLLGVYFQDCLYKIIFLQ